MYSNDFKNQNFYEFIIIFYVQNGGELSMLGEPPRSCIITYVQYVITARRGYSFHVQSSVHLYRSSTTLLRVVRRKLIQRKIYIKKRINKIKNRFVSANIRLMSIPLHESIRARAYLSTPSTPSPHRDHRRR